MRASVAGAPFVLPEVEMNPTRPCGPLSSVAVRRSGATLLRGAVTALALLMPLAGGSALAQAGVAAEGSESAPLAAVQVQRIEGLYAGLGMDRLLGIMREEGLSYGDELENEMFPGRGGERWETVVDQIYDTDRMGQIVRRQLAETLAETDLAPLEEFFGSDLGQRIVGLEIAARDALLDPGTEEAARDKLAMMQDDAHSRLDVLGRFAEANELVETNVVGALNSNFAFYQGLADGGAFEVEMDEDEMIREVWQREPDIRIETEIWVFSYLNLAYQPLTDEEIDSYTTLSLTSEGQALNRALFAAFDELFLTISGELGLAAAQFVGGQDI
ncbi:MAG: hypothetical protein CL812_12120 [Confluentimicrobium sp.]|nr:hypothetical protein [Actibacterium sp.]